MNYNEPIVRNAVTCSICGAPADRYAWGFQCQRHSGHVADFNTGIFSDLTHPDEKTLNDPKFYGRVFNDSLRILRELTCILKTDGYGMSNQDNGKPDKGKGTPMAKIMIVLPNGDSLRSDSIVGVRQGDAVEKTECVAAQVPRVIVDYTVGDNSSNCVIVDCKTPDECERLADSILMAKAYAARLTREDGVITVNANGLRFLVPESVPAKPQRICSAACTNTNCIYFGVCNYFDMKRFEDGIDF